MTLVFSLRAMGDHGCRPLCILRAAMTRRIKNRQGQAGKRRNPIARTLRAAAFRARKEQNRRRYSRKPKRKADVEPERE